MNESFMVALLILMVLGLWVCLKALDAITP